MLLKKINAKGLKGEHGSSAQPLACGGGALLAPYHDSCVTSPLPSTSYVVWLQSKSRRAGLEGGLPIHPGGIFPPLDGKIQVHD